MIQFSSGSEKKVYDKRTDEEKYFSTINSTIIKYADLQLQYPDSLQDSNTRILIEDIHLDFENPKTICEKLSIINDIAEDDNIQLTLMLDCSFAKIIDENEILIDLEGDKKRLKQLTNLKKILESTNNKFVHLFPPLTEKESIFEDEKEFEITKTSRMPRFGINLM